MSTIQLNQLMNIQYNLQSLIEIARNNDDLEFEKRLYKLRICYIKQANLIFTLQQIENELCMIDRGSIILNQNKEIILLYLLQELNSV